MCATFLKYFRKLLFKALLSIIQVCACGGNPATVWNWTKGYAQSYGVHPHLLIAVLWTEDQFCWGVSSAGAIGIAWIMPATAKELGIDPHDPVQSIKGAAKYLRQL